MKIKTNAFILLFLAVVLTVTGCHAENNTVTAQLAAYIENPPEGTDSRFYITYDEWHNEYLFNMSRGVYDEEKDAEAVENLKKNILEYQAQERVIIYLAEQEGISAESLTEEELDTINEKVQTVLKEWCKGYETEAKEALGDDYTEEQLYDKELELFTAFMAESGLTPDIFYKWETNEVIQEKFFEKTSEGISDQTVADFVQETVDAAKNAYENNIALFDQSYTAFYVPEGTRIVQQIYVKIDDAAAIEIQTCRSNGDEEKADELLAEALEAVRPVIDEAYEKLQNGEEWLTVQEEYNQDSNGNNLDYVVYPASSYISKNIIDGAMGISEKGGFSDIITSGTGLFILYYKDNRVFSDEEMQNLMKQAREYLKKQESYEKMYDFIKQYPYVYNYALMGISEPVESEPVDSEPVDSESETTADSEKE